MTKPPKTSAVSYRPGKFPPHGLAKFWIEEGKLIGTAEGPFNVEMARFVEHEIVDWCRRMRENGPFDHICEFKTSVMLGPEAMVHFQSMLQRLNQDGIAPRRMAYVMGPDVEGGGFLAPQLTKAYAAAGITMRIFLTAEEANQWLDSPAATVNRDV